MTDVVRVVIPRDVVSAHGADARSYLHSQLSNDIASLAVGESRYSFVLEPTGKLSAFVRVRCLADDHFELDTDAGAGQATLARINRFKIRVACDTALRTEQVLALRGLSSESPGDAGADARSETYAAALKLPGAVAAWRPDCGAVDVFGNVTGTAAALERFHVARVRCGWPIFGVDISTDNIPAETSLVEQCVSFTKGCYPGQELVERMDSRGSSAPKQLMRLPANVAVLQASGTDITSIAIPTSIIAAPGEAYRVDHLELGPCTSVAGDHALVMVARAHSEFARTLAAI
jgi:folate-binding protein YgfZ